VTDLNIEPEVLGSTSDQVIELQRRRPAHDAPVRLWVAWFDRYAELCDVIAQETAPSDVAGDAMWMADHQRTLAKRLRENYQPDDVWPDAPTW
jgi:hypothetical protein